MNYYEEEACNSLAHFFQAGMVRNAGDSMVYFEELARKFPANGSKINWDRVPGAIEDCEYNEALQVSRFISFFESAVGCFDLKGDVIYIGDSATDFALIADLSVMREMIGNLFNIPQHHYFIGQGFRWCMNFTMEGDMGLAPPV